MSRPLPGAALLHCTAFTDDGNTVFASARFGTNPRSLEFDSSTVVIGLRADV